MEESEIKELIANRNIRGLGTDYTIDGQKVMTWQDIDLKVGIVALFDGAGKVKSSTLIPFTTKDLYQFKELFNKEEQVLQNDIWISRIGNRHFKISAQYLAGHSKYGFIITDYDRELGSKRLEELVESLGTIPDPHISTDPSRTPIAPKGVYNTTDTSKILIDEEIFNGVKNSDHDIKTNESNAFIIAIIVGIFILGLAAYIILKN